MQKYSRLNLHDESVIMPGTSVVFQYLNSGLTNVIVGVVV